MKKIISTFEKNVLKEFDLKFKNALIETEAMAGFEENLFGKEIKSFISLTLEKQREEILERLECNFKNNSDYNKAVQDCINEIRK
jgi:hypothetical protein